MIEEKVLCTHIDTTHTLTMVLFSFSFLSNIFKKKYTTSAFKNQVSQFHFQVYFQFSVLNPSLKLYNSILYTNPVSQDMVLYSVS